MNVLFAEAGALIFTKSTTNDAYACKPSSSHPMAGNNLKNLEVAAASLDFDALSNSRLKTSSRCSRAASRVCAGGR